MTFEQFAAMHGLIVGRAVQGKWMRVATTDHPHSRNGAYKFMGAWGVVQNWATMLSPVRWTAEKIDEAKMRDVQRIANQAEQEIRQKRAKAAATADRILNDCELLPHAYFASKGFPEERVNVFKRDGEAIAVIPMRKAGQIVGCQLISEAGDKKFLTGQ